MFLLRPSTVIFNRVNSLSSLSSRGVSSGIPISNLPNSIFLIIHHTLLFEFCQQVSLRIYYVSFVTLAIISFSGAASPPERLAFSILLRS